MVKVNHARGEISYRIGADTITLVPSFENISATEVATECGLYELLQKLRDQKMPSQMAVTILETMSTPSAEKLTIERMINEGGLAKATTAVGAVLVAAIVGGESYEELLKKAEQKAKTRGKAKATKR